MKYLIIVYLMSFGLAFLLVWIMYMHKTVNKLIEEIQKIKEAQERNER